MNSKEKVNAYFTVEAAMVMPIVMGIQVLMLYLLFFQYNRCLMEQDMAALSIRANILVEEDDWTLLERMKGEAEKLYEDKYIAWQFNSPTIRLKKNEISMGQEGKQFFPFHSINWTTENMWDASILYKTKRISPMRWVRNWKKMTGGD